MAFFGGRLHPMPVPVACLTALIAASGLDATEQRIHAHVKANADAAVRFVEEVSAINSGTLNPAGVKKVGAIFEKRLAAIGLETEWIAMPKKMGRGGHLFARTKGTKGKRILLIGHLDTVFEPDDPFQEVRRTKDTLHGPGVYDMKGGDVVIVAALEALAAAGALEDTQITVALIGDEEKVGRPRKLARRDLIEAAKNTDVALGFEPGLGERHVSIARRGSSSWRAKITASGGHSSGVGRKKLGYGAIYEASRFLDATRKMFSKSRSLTINPGMIVGGTAAERDGTTGTASGKTNKIAAIAHIAGDLRFLTEEEKANARKAMKKIAKRALPHAKVELEFTDGYPAMPPTKANRAIFKVLDRVSRDLGGGRLEIVPPQNRGAADISFVAPFAGAALAGLGPDGRGAHTRDEHMVIAHLEIATARAALLIYRLTR